MEEITRKLQWLKTSNQNASHSRNQRDNAPLWAVREHFNGTLLYPKLPVLLIKAKQNIALPEKIDLYWPSKGQFDEEIPMEECLFFDLETTGLQGGSGVYAFLLGFARYKDGIVHFRQYFLPDYGREGPLFSALNDWFQAFRYLISYNGKSFDLPVLSSRFLMNRQELTLHNLHHVDLVHLSRRIWKNSLRQCDLQTIEKDILRIKRSNDISGNMIPQAYIDFLRAGRVHDIIRVIEHNRQDLNTMPLLLAKLHHISRAPAEHLNASSALTMARSTFQMPDAEALYEKLEQIKEVSRDEKFLFLKSMLLKHNKKYDRAYPLWEKLFTNPHYTYIALEEAAKYFEHRLKKFKAALELTDKALYQLEMQEEFGLRQDALYDSFMKRRHRLEEKILKNSVLT